MASRPQLRSALRRSLQLWRWLWPLPYTLLGLTLGAVACLAGARMRVEQRTIEVSGGRLGAWAGRGVGPFGVTAITLGHVILGSSAAMLAQLRVHEQVHVHQYERWGVFFAPAYWASSLWQILIGRHPYRDNTFERAAFAAECAARPAAQVGGAPRMGPIPCPIASTPSAPLDLAKDPRDVQPLGIEP